MGHKEKYPITGKIKNLKLFRYAKVQQHWWVTGPGIVAFESDRNTTVKVARALNRVLKEYFGEKKIKGGKFARRKGHTFERDLAIMLRPWFPKARRQLEFQKDCALGVDLAETGRFKFQCKKLKKYAPISTMDEIQCDRDLLGDIPVLVTAADNLPAMVVMHLDDFLAILPKNK